MGVNSGQSLILFFFSLSMLTTLVISFSLVALIINYIPMTPKFLSPVPELTCPAAKTQTLHLDIRLKVKMFKEELLIPHSP
jgi:hypothetical protein